MRRSRHTNYRPQLVVGLGAAVDAALVGTKMADPERFLWAVSSDLLGGFRRDDPLILAWPKCTRNRMVVLLTLDVEPRLSRNAYG